MGEQGWLHEVGVSYRTLGSEGLTHDSVLWAAVLNLLIIFKHGALHFRFALGSTNYAAGPAYGLVVETTVLILRGL